MLTSAPTDHRSDPADREQMLGNPDLHAAVVRALRGRVPEADVDALLWQTMYAAYTAKNLPAAGADRTAYVVTIARNLAVGLHRRSKRRPEIADGQDVDQHGARATDSIGDRDLIEKIGARVSARQGAVFVWLARHLLGESVVEIAREAQVNADVVYKGVAAAKQRARVVGIQLAAGALALLVIGVAWSILRPKQPIALPDRPVPTEEPASSTQKPEPQSTLERARELREQAFAACEKKDWPACEKLLDDAQKLDRAAEDDPRVDYARKEIEMNRPREIGSKPSMPRGSR